MDIAAIRARFRSLRQGFAFFDGGRRHRARSGRPAPTWPRVADERIGVWAHDSWYSLGLYQRLGYRDKSVRLGFTHYNTTDEVDRLLAALDAVAR